MEREGEDRARCTTPASSRSTPFSSVFSQRSVRVFMTGLVCEQRVYSAQSRACFISPGAYNTQISSSSCCRSSYVCSV